MSEFWGSLVLVSLSSETVREGGVQSSFKLHQTEIGFSSLSVNLSQRCCFMGSYLGFC